MKRETLLDLLKFNPLRARGMADVAWRAFALGSYRAGIDITERADFRAVQLIGDAAASKKYHLSDGVLNGRRYTAAADFSVRDLTRTEIATWIEELSAVGFANFFRNWVGNLHIHGNYCGVPQKSQLEGQNEDFFSGRDGLVSHSRITQEWWYPEQDRRQIAHQMFQQAKKGKVVESPAVVAFLKSEDKKPQTFALHLNNELEPRFWMPVFDGVAYAPVRAFGSALGFKTNYLPEKKQIEYDGEDMPIALKIIAGVGHAPIRQLTAECQLKLIYEPKLRKVVVTR